MSACGSYVELISAQLDGALAADERVRLTEHLATCGACRTYMAELAAIRAALSDSEDVDVPEGFADGVMRRVHESAPKAKKPSLMRRFAPLAACAAVLAIVFASGIGFGGASGGTMAGDAAAAKLRQHVEPLELAALFVKTPQGDTAHHAALRQRHIEPSVRAAVFLLQVAQLLLIVLLPEIAGHFRFPFDQHSGILGEERCQFLPVVIAGNDDPVHIFAP